MSLTPGKGWASGEFGALKNILVVVNLVGMLKITWGAAKTTAVGPPPQGLHSLAWVGPGQQNLLQVPQVAPVCSLH